LTPPKPRHIPRPFANHHLKDDAIGRRGFTWEVIKQLFEDYWDQCDPMEEVKGDREEVFPPNRMVLQFKQGKHFYRMAFDLFANEIFPNKPPYEAEIITMFHDGPNPGLPDCDYIEIKDYDLPTENIQ
jgi:hypothetical protein